MEADTNHVYTFVYYGTKKVIYDTESFLVYYILTNAQF